MDSGQVKQGERVLSNRNERIDTKNGTVTVGGGTTIYDWIDHSVSLFKENPAVPMPATS